MINYTVHVIRPEGAENGTLALKNKKKKCIHCETKYAFEGLVFP
jgi:hypothetical protein